MNSTPSLGATPSLAFNWPNADRLQEVDSLRLARNLECPVHNHEATSPFGWCLHLVSTSLSIRALTTTHGTA